MTFRYRACAAALLQPAPRPVAVHRMTRSAADVSEPPGSRRRGSALASALIAAGGCVLAAPAAAAARGVPASQPLVVLLRDHVARTEPSAHARRIEVGRTPAVR